jgi:hypothetical protein
MDRGRRVTKRPDRFEDGAEWAPDEDGEDSCVEEDGAEEASDEDGEVSCVDEDGVEGASDSD